jgi:hypothetical protein
VVEENPQVWGDPGSHGWEAWEEIKVMKKNNP